MDVCLTDALHGVNCVTWAQAQGLWGEGTFLFCTFPPSLCTFNMYMFYFYVKIQEVLLPAKVRHPGGLDVSEDEMGLAHPCFSGFSTVCGLGVGVLVSACHLNLWIPACLCRHYLSSINVGASLAREDTHPYPLFVVSADLQSLNPALTPKRCCFLSTRCSGLWTQWCLPAHSLPLSEEVRGGMLNIWWDDMKGAGEGGGGHCSE